MNTPGFRATIALFSIVAIAAPVRAVNYTATLLHTVGSSAYGASNENQVGSDSIHALMWSGPGSVVDLHPAGYANSFALGISGANQVGYAQTPSPNFLSRAMLWSGTAASAENLHPAGFITSFATDVATDVSGSSQVGHGYLANGFAHALLWRGTAASKVDLHPTGFDSSFAIGASATTQAGLGVTVDGDLRALLWSGTAASVVSLHPAGFTSSRVDDVFGGTQVGSGYGPSTDDYDHALLWDGTAANKLDLHPAGFDASQAVGISAAGQVGNGFGSATGGNIHALLWDGTAASAVDLHPLLSGLGPAFVRSQATDIADNGTIVGYAWDENFNSYAVLWTPVEEVLGDYNNNGVVDAADYVLWRKGANNLQNEVVTIGSNTPGDYDEWIERFGDGGGGAGGAAVPEPSSIASLVLCLAWMTARRNARGMAPASSR